MAGESEQLLLVGPQHRFVLPHVHAGHDVIEVNNGLLGVVANDDEEAALLRLEAIADERWNTRVARGFVLVLCNFINLSDDRCLHCLLYRHGCGSRGLASGQWSTKAIEKQMEGPKLKSIGRHNYFSAGRCGNLQKSSTYRLPSGLGADPAKPGGGASEQCHGNPKRLSLEFNSSSMVSEIQPLVGFGSYK